MVFCSVLCFVHYKPGQDRHILLLRCRTYTRFIGEEFEGTSLANKSYIACANITLNDQNRLFMQDYGVCTYRICAFFGINAGDDKTKKVGFAQVDGRDYVPQMTVMVSLCQ